MKTIKDPKNLLTEKQKEALQNYVKVNYGRKYVSYLSVRKNALDESKVSIEIVSNRDINEVVSMKLVK